MFTDVVGSVGSGYNTSTKMNCGPHNLFFTRVTNVTLAASSNASYLFSNTQRDVEGFWESFKHPRHVLCLTYTIYI